MSTTSLRLSLAALTTLAGACTDDDAAAGRGPVAGRATTAAPGPRVHAPLDPPGRCLTAPGVVRFGTTADDRFTDLVVTSGGEIVAAGHEQGQYVDDVLTIGRAVAVTISPDLTTLTRRTSALGPAIARTIGALAIDRTTDRVLFAAPGLTGAVLGDLPAAGGHRELARTRFNYTPHQPHDLALGADGFLVVVGESGYTEPSGEIVRDPFLWAYAVAGDELTGLHAITRPLAPRERNSAVDVSADRTAFGGDIEDGEQAGMQLALRDHDAGPVWTTRLSKDGADRLAAVRILPDGDVVWLGTRAGTLADGALGGTDLVVGRLDGATGASAWTYHLGGAGDDHAAGLALDRDGRLLVVGNVTSDRGDLDIALYTVTDEGVVAAETWGHTDDERATAITTDACGAIAIAGHTAGDFAGAPAGGQDAFVMVTGVAE